MKYCTITIGTYLAGYTQEDVDYICDGIDDQIEINAAISSLNNGGLIRILNGTYNLSQKIYVDKNMISIEGDGNYTIINGADVPNEVSFHVFQNNYFSLKNIKIILSKDNDIKIENCNGARIQNICVEAPTKKFSIGIISTDCENLIICDSVINNGINCGGINKEQKYNIIANNSISSTNNMNGIAFGGNSKHTHIIFGNDITGSDNGISINTPLQNVMTLISDNIIEEAYTGIFIDASNILTNNNMVNNVINDGTETAELHVDQNSKLQLTACNKLMKGAGNTSDYKDTDYTIKTYASDSLIVNNMILGKDVTNIGSNNTIVNNRAVK